VVNNAAILRDAFVFRADPRDWDAVIRNNLSAAFYLINAASAVMRDQGKSGRVGAGGYDWGRIVNIVSSAGPVLKPRSGGLCQRQGRPVRAHPRDGDGPSRAPRSRQTPWRRSRARASPTSSSRPTTPRNPTRSARSRSARTMSPTW
jgi:NAD(P)-dependent dehydrogenase (short-subunit alcohol dehydrogenase family)